MRILHVMASGPSGAAEAMMLNGVAALADAGVAQFALTRDSATARRSALKAVGVDYETAPFHPLWRAQTTARLKAAHQIFKPDVVHHWMARAGSFALPQTRARNLGWHPGHYRLDRFKACAWHATVSPHAASELQSHGAPADRTLVVPAFVDGAAQAAPIARASLSTPDDAPVVFAAVRPAGARGVAALVQALGALPGVYAWIAADAAMGDPVRALAAEADVSERVRIVSLRDDHAALIAACDVVAMPTRPEPLNVLALHAWSAGKPVIAVDEQCGAAHLTADRDAIIVAPDNGAALRAGLAQALEDASLTSALVAQGRRSFDANHTRQAFVRSALAAYERIHAEAAART